MPYTTVIVAGENPAMRMKLVKALGMVRGFQVISQASDLPATYTAAEALEPDVVLIARDLTELPEFALMRSLFRALDARWIPVDHRGIADSTEFLCGKADAADDNAPIDTAETPAEIAAKIVVALRRCVSREALYPAKPIRSADSTMPGKLILIGASTGGVDALLAILSSLPVDCPPVAVVQHTGQGFSEGLIRLLDRRSTVTVEAAQDGMELRQGRVCVAAGCAGHMRLRSSKPYRIGVEAGPLISGHLPSVDALFHSAVPFGGSVVAAVLTGMGRDGASGLLALRNVGAMTIGQDEISSVVYGMPRAAWELGAVRQQVPLNNIAGAILRACTQGCRAGRGIP